MWSLEDFNIYFRENETKKMLRHLMSTVKTALTQRFFERVLGVPSGPWGHILRTVVLRQWSLNDFDQKPYH